ncbi:MAG: redoxin domain-containing protein [SAR202 cluster bacterium]|nr:redoxin domain-containing protein [SAR202 cluster bacterium]
MPEVERPVPAPDLQGGSWVQGGPLSLAQLKGKVVLVDFWDYTCVNCLRTLPYLKEWHRRYGGSGLTIVGVHAPEFSFARDALPVRSTAVAAGLDYPIVLDNDRKIWRAYSNRYWPAKYLVDGRGLVRYVHFGEGAYGETEEAIQKLLRETGPGLALPPLMEPVRDSDRPGTACYMVTPELYLGYQRGRLGNPRGYTPDQVAEYHDPGRHAEGYVYLSGRWLCNAEAALYAGSSGEGTIALRYTAKEVNLVLNPLSGQPGTLTVRQDGLPLDPHDAADDVLRDGAGRPCVTVDGPRMYRLVNNRELGSHELALSTASAGLGAYAFTFVSCVVPGDEG